MLHSVFISHYFTLIHKRITIQYLFFFDICKFALNMVNNDEYNTKHMSCSYLIRSMYPGTLITGMSGNNTQSVNDVNCIKTKIFQVINSVHLLNIVACLSNVFLYKLFCYREILIFYIFAQPKYLYLFYRFIYRYFIYIYCLGTRGIASLLSLETQLLLEAQPRAIVGVESDNKLALLRGSSQ